MKKQLRIAISLFLLLQCFVGCRDETPVVLTGFTCTGQDLWQSAVLHNIKKHSDYQPIAGARIYLCFDEEKNQPITGFQTASDQNGMYQISLKDLPPSKDLEDYY